MKADPRARMGAETSGQKDRDSWSTPRWVVDAASDSIGLLFGIDVAAASYNAVCDQWIDEDEDALLVGGEQWTRRINPRIEAVWCNPPYSQLKHNQWSIECAKAAEFATVVMLVPAKIDTRWYRILRRSGRVEKILEPKGRIDFIPNPVTIDRARSVRYMENHNRWRRDKDGYYRFAGGGVVHEDIANAKLVAYIESANHKDYYSEYDRIINKIEQTQASSSSPGGTWLIVLSPKGSFSPRLEALGWLEDKNART